MTNDEPIYTDPTQAAELHHAGISLPFASLEEAVAAWRRLSPAEKEAARIRVGGASYGRSDIERLRYGHQPGAADGL